MESKKNNLKRYGLIGKNIEYSFSRGYFKEKFENENLPDCSYENFDLNHINEVKEVLGTPGIFGLNVTIPYKREIIPFEIIASLSASNIMMLLLDLKVNSSH